MKISSIILLLSVFILNLHGQEIRVIDIDSGDPLEAVSVINHSNSEIFLTDQQGRVKVTESSGEQLFEIRLIGYVPQSLKLEDIRRSGYLIKMTKEQLLLDQVVVSALRRELKGSEVSNRISTIDRSEILAQNPPTSADLLGLSGHVYVQKSQQGGGSPMIRGFAANRLLYSIDGVRMNTAIFRSGNLHNVIAIDALSVESAEVLFGPGSVIYGSDAIGGVMSFTTLKPTFLDTSGLETLGSIMARYSSANSERTVHADVNFATQDWSALTSVTFSSFDDLEMGSQGPDDYLRLKYADRRSGVDIEVENRNPELQVGSGYDQFNVLQKLHWRRDTSLRFGVDIQFSRSGDIPRYDRLIREENGILKSAEWYYGTQVWGLANVFVENDRPTKLYDGHVIRLAYQFFEESRVDRDFEDVIKTTRTERVDAYSMNLDFSKSIHSDLDLGYGLETVFNQVGSNGQSVNIDSQDRSRTSSRYPESNWMSNAVYSTLRYKFSSSTTVQLAARYNHFYLKADFGKNVDFYPLPFTTTDLSDHALSASLGLVHRWKDNVILRLNMGRGFRSPNVDDIGKIFDSEPGTVIVPNDQLRSEVANSIDLGVAARLGRHFDLEISGFYTYLDNAMVRRNFTLNGQDSVIYDGEMSRVLAIQNASFAEVYGLEIGATWKFFDHWQLEGRLTLQEGTEEMDSGITSPSRHVPPNYGSTILTYQRHKVRMALSYIFNEGRSFEEMPLEEINKPFIYASDRNGNPYVPSWYTLNFKVNYALTSYLSLTAGVDNITDQRYRPYSSGMAGAGRNFVLAVKATMY